MIHGVILKRNAHICNVHYESYDNYQNLPKRF